MPANPKRKKVSARVAHPSVRSEPPQPPNRLMSVIAQDPSVRKGRTGAVYETDGQAAQDDTVNNAGKAWEEDKQERSAEGDAVECVRAWKLVEKHRGRDSIHLWPQHGHHAQLFRFNE